MEETMCKTNSFDNDHFNIYAPCKASNRCLFTHTFVNHVCKLWERAIFNDLFINTFNPIYEYPKSNFAIFVMLSRHYLDEERDTQEGSLCLQGNRAEQGSFQIHSRDKNKISRWQQKYITSPNLIEIQQSIALSQYSAQSDWRRCFTCA